jgi:hypothetical protein
MSDEFGGPEESKPGDDAGFDELARRAGAALRRPAPAEGVRAITQRHRRQQALKLTVVGGVTVAALIGTLAFAATRNEPDSVAPVDSPPVTLAATTIPPPATATVATDAPTVDTAPSTAAVLAPDAESTTTSAPPPRSSWPTFTSTRYGTEGNGYVYPFTVGHPPDWTEIPSSRDWNWETDVQDPLSVAHEAFVSPDNAIRVSAWNAPFDGSAPAPWTDGPQEPRFDDLVAWVEDYCRRSGNSPCDGIADRAIELCLERRDCHPGLLVPFENDVQAFFTGGIYSPTAMTIVAVWQSESAPAVAPYGGAQQLLESFLATMEVWPASTPFSERN